MKNILFVCSGNTCRSPMAEGYLNSLGLSDINALSCGFGDGGDSVNEKSSEAMLSLGVDISGHKSRPISLEILSLSDNIYCMAEGHRTAILRTGISEDKVFLLGGGIADPFGGDSELYRKTRDKIVDAIDEIFSPVKYDISPLNRENVDGVWQLERECFYNPWKREQLISAAKYGTDFFVASHEGRVIGYCGIKIVAGEGYITNIAVTKDFRGKGVAKALLSALMRHCEQLYCSFVTLEVRQSNVGAISLYKKFGFKKEGTRRGFYDDPKEDADIYTKKFIW